MGNVDTMAGLRRQGRGPYPSPREAVYRIHTSLGTSLDASKNASLFKDGGHQLGLWRSTSRVIYVIDPESIFEMCESDSRVRGVVASRSDAGERESPRARCMETPAHPKPLLARGEREPPRI